MRRGDHHSTNRMFRNRIYAQGFTIAAMVAGSMYYQVDRKKRKEFEGTVAERKAKEKNEAWIRELEARDQEDKEEKARRAAIRDAKWGGGAAATKVVEIGEVKGERDVVEIAEPKGDVVESAKAKGGMGVTDAVRDTLTRKK